MVDKNASIASYLCGEHSWNPEFKRLPQDRELQFIDNFVIYCILISLLDRGSNILETNKKGKLKVHSTMKF